MLHIQELDHLKIPLQDIKSATDNFSDRNFIGHDGFGRVYKGQLLHPTSGGRHPTVAVNQLDIKGRPDQYEFLMEIVMLSSHKHDNLVSLIGFSDEGDEKIIVYEHEVRGSLDKYLASTDLTWVQRLQVCLDVARGLDYIHNCVLEGHGALHRDIKSSNILLDENFQAKISGFRLSKTGSTNACGTYGYVDPQYIQTGVLTKESDIYSFGVVLFEVLCGRLAIIRDYEDERRFLSKLAKLYYKQEKLDEIILPNILKQINPNSLQTFSKSAYRCLKRDRKERPTIGLIVEELQIALEFQIGCRRIRRMGLWGSTTGGSPWWFQLERNHKLRKIRIDHEDWIYSIGFTIEDSSGSLHSSPEYGGAGGWSGGGVSEINFDADEEITMMVGTVGMTTGYYAGYKVISSLCFVTNKRRNGPFGKETETTFSVPCDTGSVVGFYGRCGFYLDGIGCYLNEFV